MCKASGLCIWAPMLALALLGRRASSHVVMESPKSRNQHHAEVTAANTLASSPYNIDHYGVWYGGNQQSQNAFSLRHPGDVTYSGRKVNPKPAGFACGDPYQDAPRWDDQSNWLDMHSRTNSLYPVLTSYTAGQVITLKLNFYAVHLGYVEAKICNMASDGIVTQTCFDQKPLNRVTSGASSPYTPIQSTKSGRYYMPCNNVTGMTTVDYQLPAGFTCTHCVIQLTYVTGNSCVSSDTKSWYQSQGCPSNLSSCVETTYPFMSFPMAEVFWGCSDISIGGGGPTPSTQTQTLGAPTIKPVAPTQAPTQATATGTTPSGCNTCHGCWWTATTYDVGCYAWPKSTCDAQTSAYVWCP